ncbi:MAG: pyrroline-5-carboxylate reductase [Gammaproteobacteria bacterium]
MDNPNICFIGCGNMGQSLIGGLIANGQAPERIHGADPDTAKQQLLRQKYGITVHADNTSAVEQAEVVILAVKPQVLLQTLTDISAPIKDRSLLTISIAAGIRSSALEAVLGKNLPIVRVMPNTPALIQAGTSALYANAAVTESQRELAEAIMRSVGLALWLEDESLMDTVTAVSGSGPAYFFLIMEIMEKAAVKLGLPVDQARLLTLETAFGAAKMALESEADAATLRQQVTSPGGTTEQALQILMDKGNIEQLFLEALTAAKQRSEQLAEAAEGPA